MPVSINYSFNFGIILLVIYVCLLATGFFCTFFYNNLLSVSFSNLIYSQVNIFFFFLLRVFHNTFANLFFAFMFFHIFKSFFYSSSQVIITMILGIIIFVVACAIAFFGYCLPMGQMSFWAAVVIFSLLSVLPFGTLIIYYLFGSFSISARTLSLLFFLHFFFPFILFVLIFSHLYNLHSSLSSSTGFNDFYDLVFFNPLFILIDSFIVIIFFLFFFVIVFFYSFFFFEHANFCQFNTMATPLHIYPDWFLLFPYACLRSVDSKLFGVFLLIIIMIGLFASGLFSAAFKTNSIYSIYNIVVIFTFVLIMFSGSFPSVYPFSILIIGLQFFIYIFFLFYFFAFYVFSLF